MARSTAVALLTTGVLGLVLYGSNHQDRQVPSSRPASRTDSAEESRADARWSRPSIGAGGAATSKPVPDAKLALLSDLDPNQIYRPALALQAADVFTAVEPPPPPRPPAPPAPKLVTKPLPAPVVPAPLPPSPPPMPFRFIGRYEDAGARRVFLATSTEAFTVAEGDVLQGMWRVIAIASDRVELLYLPLEAKQVVVIP
jgi:hypothetical protein